MDASKSSGYQDFEWAVKLNRFTLRVIGLWPGSERSGQEKPTRSLRPVLIVLMLVIGILIPAVHSLIRIRSNLMLTIDNLQFTLPAITCAIRITIFWWKREAIMWVLNMVADDWLRLKSERERRAMVRRAQTARVVVACAYGVMTIAYFLCTILPAFGVSIRYTTNLTDPEGRALPLQTHYPYDVGRRPFYELTFAVQSVCILLAIMSYTGIDNFLGLLVFHICGQLEILRDRIARLDTFVDFHDMLRSSVIDHTRLLRNTICLAVTGDLISSSYRAIAIIEDTFNMMLLALFLYFAIQFALYGFLIITLLEKGNDMSITRLIYQVSIVINTFGHMCLYCAVGEILVAQCDRVHRAVYDFKWYSLDPRAARGLIFLMLRSSKPIHLTAGKVFPMTMATFCNLLKTSASYISVLLTTKS